VRKTIFEHAPDSHAAQDYAQLVEHVRRIRGDARLLDRDESTSSAVGLRAGAPHIAEDTAALAG